MKYQNIPTNISGIYKINYPNGKIYIGRAINIKRRIWEHYSKEDGTSCQKALKKYFLSYNDIDIDILESIEVYDYDKICELEKKWIKIYNSNNKNIGYNLTFGGDGADCGVNNVSAKFSEKDLENIIKLLKEQRTNVYIGNLYNVHPDTIGHINQGKTYYNDKINYPIRKGPGIKDYKDKYNTFTEEQLDSVIYLLSTTSLSRQEISEQIGISVSTITKINTGKHPYCKKVKIDFPIRKTRRTIPLTQEEIVEIKKELLNKNFSIKDIAKHFNCSTDTISDINLGKRYRNINENYPIRTFYPNRGSKKPVSTILESEE